MKLRIWGIAALAAGLVAASAASLRAQTANDADMSEMPADVGQPLEQMEQSEFGAYDSCNTCPTGACGGYGCGGMIGGGSLLGDLSGGRRVQLVAGAEYIYAQATFSEATAFLEQDLVSPAGGEIYHQIDFDYESSYSFYGGAYLPDCGGAVIFDYTRLTSSGEYAATETAGVNNILGPLEINGNIEGRADVDLKSYDASFSKTIPLGCLISGTDCGACVDQCCDSGCGGGWCPAWDITWSGGVRFATVDWSNEITALAAAPGFPESARTSLNFDGFGGRVGIMGRRYLGKRGLASLYGKGDFSVLFGEADLEALVNSTAGQAFTRLSNDITVPVTEVELGGSLHLGAHATLSAGYFWAAWHDLGMSPTFDFDVQVPHFDDANILGWNGLFARAEVAF